MSNNKSLEKAFAYPVLGRSNDYLDAEFQVAIEIKDQEVIYDVNQFLVEWNGNEGTNFDSVEAFNKGMQIACEGQIFLAPLEF